MNEEMQNLAQELMQAAHMGELAAVQRLITAGADVNAVAEGGWTALTKACYNPDLGHGHPEVVKALIAAGADIEAPIGYGVRPLMLAAGYGETAIVELLLQAGADVLAKNEGGYTALMMVMQKNYIDVINLLYEAEQLARQGEQQACSSRTAPTNVITFMKPPGKK